MGNKTTLILALLLTTLVLTACTKSADTSPVDTQAIQVEITRLSTLASTEQITESDFGTLSTMLSADEDASGEVEEMVLLTKYQEYMHVGHGLGFLASYVQTGKETLCPPHALGHYYVFMRHNETEHAEEALQHIDEEYADWEPKARAYDATYPSGQDFSAVAATVKAHIDRIHAGDTTATDDEISFLTGKGSICVEG